ncbi:FliA/WhiG family RNA polymerase sigma factor [Iocasia frigidifontis]|uniref:FliA/WhiG family RNA polymerase sigma factor n=1 Tax=Iocasia fonsfrigidae TaxID=2682810 RepID=A0A8A7KC76_9FIRM|nr:FliA/WhiG family RNA polymerase sigma factor [Iocasia fonsfrigidae]QTL96979.1 FliA/WhiG family RNA polymerase sigma factor [Iocasia fonsfrigidae]
MPLADKEVAEIELWREFKENDSQAARQELIIKYLPQVKYQAGRLKMIVPDFIEQDDLESYGVIGLIDALYKFDYRKGIKFKTYASRRIRGEIIDYLRKLDWLPHSVRREGKQLKSAADRFFQKYGRRPSVDELATALNISKEKVSKLYYQIYSSQWVSVHEEIGDVELLDLLKEDQKSQPEVVYHRKNSERLLSEAIEHLNESERLVISLYYYEGLTQAEIAEVMELSSARVSQLHKKAIYRLRGSLARKKEQLL